jgi:hypothetical protein
MLQLVIFYLRGDAQLLQGTASASSNKVGNLSVFKKGLQIIFNTTIGVLQWEVISLQEIPHLGLLNLKILLI